MSKDGTDARLLKRGMQVLYAVSSSEEPMTFGGIQQTTKLPKATLSRILTSLRIEDYLALDTSGKRYNLGPKLLDMMAHSEPARALRLTSKVEIQRLADELEQPVWHWRVQSDQMMPIEQILPFGMTADSIVRTASRLDRSAAGIAVLSAMESVRLSSILEALRGSCSPPENHISLSLGFSAATGFAVHVLDSNERNLMGHSGIVDEVAVAIIDELGEPITALSVLCDTENISETDIHQIGRKIAFTARQISSGPHIGPRRKDVVQRKPDGWLANSNNTNVEILDCQPPDKVGSNPFWEAKNARIIWIDSLGGAINWCHPPLPNFANNGVSDRYSFNRVDIQGLPGAIIPYRGEKFIVALRDGITLMDLDKGTRSVLSHPEPNDTLRRFSTAQIGPDNRIWVGSLRPVPMAGLGQGRIYALDQNGRIERVLDLERGAKGMCWSPDGKYLYLTQAGSKSILRFEMDEHSGLPVNPRLFARHSGSGTPNGITIDNEGCLWAAIYGGWQVVRFDPNGQILEEIELPIPLPTGLCFGGAKQKDLYITSCRLHVPPEVLVDAPASGALLRLATKTSGIDGRQFLIKQ